MCDVNRERRAICNQKCVNQAFRPTGELSIYGTLKVHSSPNWNAPGFSPMTIIDNIAVCKFSCLYSSGYCIVEKANASMMMQIEIDKISASHFFVCFFVSKSDRHYKQIESRISHSILDGKTWLSRHWHVTTFRGWHSRLLDVYYPSICLFRKRGEIRQVYAKRWDPYWLAESLI